MRLRQAHAILEAATALEAAGLGFKIQPLHSDYPGNMVDSDRMAGGTDLTDPDTGDRDARSYNIDLLPGPDADTIEACLTVGFGPEQEFLLYTKRSVALEVRGDEQFRGLVGAQLAADIADKVREHEQPYRAAYEQRRNTQPDKETP